MAFVTFYTKIALTFNEILLETIFYLFFFEFFVQNTEITFYLNILITNI